MTDIINKYNKTVKLVFEVKGRDFGLNHHLLEEEDKNHLIQLGASVLLTRDDILHGGSFVQSIIKNDLWATFTRADHIAETGIKFFLYLREYVHLDEQGNML